MTTSLEHADRVLTPSADYCRLEANGSCSAITGFGNGILQFGFVLEADITSVVSSGTVAYVRDFSTVVSSEVPEPATGLLVLAAGLVWRLRRGRR